MKGLSEIKADNAAVPAPPPSNRDPIVLRALKVARASLMDVMQNGDGQVQRQNINQTDLPIIQRAITLMEAN